MFGEKGTGKVDNSYLSFCRVGRGFPGDYVSLAKAGMLGIPHLYKELQEPPESLM